MYTEWRRVLKVDAAEALAVLEAPEVVQLATFQKPPAPQPCEVSERAGRLRPRGAARPHLFVSQRQVLDSLDVDRLRERNIAQIAPKLVSRKLQRGSRRLWRTHLANFGADLIYGESHRGDTSPSGGTTPTSSARSCQLGRPGCASCLCVCVAA